MSSPQSAYELQAEVYDLIYSHKDYRQEARQVHEIIEHYRRSTGNRLLDVACGTGRHDEYFTEWYEVEGLDLSPAQLAIARRRLPQLTFYQGDMTNFDLGRQYSAVTCLFSAIAHAVSGEGQPFSLEPLHRAIASMARHLAPGGVLVVEPWLSPETYKLGTIHPRPAADCSSAARWASRNPAPATPA